MKFFAGLWMKRGRVWLAFLLLNPLFVGLFVLFYHTVTNSDTLCLLVDHRAFYLGLPLIRMHINFNLRDHIKLRMYILIKYVLDIMWVHWYLFLENGKSCFKLLFVLETWHVSSFTWRDAWTKILWETVLKWLSLGLI
jgi:hypothetical protein